MEGGFWFAVVLNLKHIFLYLAPAYFLHLLRDYCFQLQGPSQPKKPIFSLWNFTKLGSVVASVFLVTFGPFLWLVG